MAERFIFTPELLEKAKMGPTEDEDGVLTQAGMEVAQTYASAWQSGRRDVNTERAHPELVGLLYDIRNDPDLAREHAIPFQKSDANRAVIERYTVSPEFLGLELRKAGQAVIAIGKKGGKIVGYSKGKPIYEGSAAAKKLKQKKQMETAASGLNDSIKQGKHSGSVSQHVKEMKAELGKHATQLEKSLADLRGLAPGDAKVKGRTKTLDSAIGKMSRKPKYQQSNQLQDLTGMRVVCSSVADVKNTVQKIRGKYTVVDFDNYVDEPLGDMRYRSVHLIIKGEDGLEKEVQVRTGGMNVVADWTHDVYKPVNEKQEAVLQKHAADLNKFAAILSDHVFSRDKGERPPDPPNPGCPGFIAQTFGCPAI